MVSDGPFPLYLASDGVFPIHHGEGEAATGLPLSGTIQGEGLLAGVPSLFVRLAGCNLRCQWKTATGGSIPCDTPHALTGPGTPMDLEEVAETIAQYSGRISHVVLTGGEPLLQAKPLAALIARLHGGQKRYHVTLESNGTLYDGEVARQIDLVSLSPKLLPQLLDAEGYPTSQYVHTLQDWLEAKQKHPVGLQLKFVVSKLEDETQILRFLDRLQGCDCHPIFVMPLGRRLSEIRESALAAVSIAIRNNWRYSPRLQVDIWGDRVGV